MNKRLLTNALALLASLVLAPSAQAAFDVTGFDVTYTNKDGSPALTAGSHPDAMTTTIDFSVLEDEESGKFISDGSIKDLAVELPTGLVGDREAVPYCSTADFLFIDAQTEATKCPDNTGVGILYVREPGEAPPGGAIGPAFNLQPPPGVAAKIGIVLLHVPVAILIRVNPDYPHNLTATVQNTSDVEPLGGTQLTIWGNPASSSHDDERGQCSIYPGTCPVDLEEKPFLTLPRACTGPLFTEYAATSWETPNVAITGQSASPLETIGCGKLPFNPTISAKPTSIAANSASGLDFSLDVKDENLTSPDGQAASDIKKTIVTLPEGFSVNPSVAEGLEVCSEAEVARETPFSAPGAGCPQASKIGTVEVTSPLLNESVNGALYQATPYENPFDSLIALYVVIKNPTLGIVVRQPLKVESDLVTGQLRTTADDIPQLPFSHFRLHFREGARSPLVTPAACGDYDVKAQLFPWSGGTPTTTTSTFDVVVGPESGPCPSGGLPPFKPGLIAGTINNAAGSFSPFNVRMFRTDSEQEITRFSIKLPPGISGKLAGIPYCPDAAIAAAKARTGPHGGQEELDNPSCPAASQIGRSLAGSGVGSALAYAPGKLYLAGPYNGSNLSMVSITSGVVGPFDIGTVVVRLGFKIDPETAEVFVDSTGSDPIPHIIKGIPVHLRDIRAYTDRPEFVLNPTSCKRTSTASTLLGAGLDFGSDHDNNPVTVSTPFQAADCAALPFQPRLSLQLKGGTKRGDFPALKATLRMGGIGEAGIAKAQVTLPRAAFVEQSHFNTICTRVQFKAGAGNGVECPKGSIYGKARAITPILGEPLTGPVYLRSSEHQLPDLVVALHNSQVDFNLVGRVDAIKGRLRNTFETAPDAPVSSFVLEMQGGKKGLFVNSTDLCKGKPRAIAKFTGQNGKRHNFRPAFKAKCPKGGKAPGKRR